MNAPRQGLLYFYVDVHRLTQAEAFGIETTNTMDYFYETHKIGLP